MERKEGLVLFLVCVVICFSFLVSAECEEEDIIFRVSSDSKSFASLWDYLDSPVSLCYSDFFGEKYIGENIRECNGGNSIAYLQSEGDSNVSFNEYEYIYTIPGGTEGEILCKGDVKVTLSGKVSGCRKGRKTADYPLTIPVNFYTFPGEANELKIQSNVRVRKQSNCGEFTWTYYVTCDEEGNLLLGSTSKNMKRVSSNVVASPVRGKVGSGYTILSSWLSNYFRSGDSKNGYFNTAAYMAVAEYNPPNYEVEVILDGKVTGCRKGRSTQDYSVKIPIYFDAKETPSKLFFIQSNVAVRKQSNCGEFLWFFEVTKGSGNNILVNGKSGAVKLDWQRGRVANGLTKVYELPQKYFGSGSSRNGYVNPSVYTISPLLQRKFSALEDVQQLVKFDIPICYGDLNCDLREGKCEEDEIVLASLESEVNSKISIGNDKSYDYKICCYKDPFLDIDAYWANMFGDPINKTSKGDSVRLAIDFDVEGLDVNYTIYKLGEPSWNVFNWFSRKIDEVSSENEYPVWVASEPGKYYFEASYIDKEGVFVKVTSNKEGSSNNFYGILDVSNKVNNSRPMINITFPDSYSEWGMNSEILFQADVFDEDDDLRITWNFGDSTTVVRENCLTGGNCSVAHSYNLANGGVIYASAIVEEMGRGSPNRAEDAVALLIYSEGINLFPMIIEPEFGKSFNESNILFNASDSYIANCTSGSKCVFPTGKVSVEHCYTPGDTNLKCFDYPDEIFDGENYELHFLWSFSEGPDHSGNYSSKGAEAFEFRRIFSEAKDHSAELKIGFERLK